MYYNELLDAAHHVVSALFSVSLLLLHLFDYFLGAADYTLTALDFLIVHQVVDELLDDLLSLLVLVAID